ncbi:MAG: hypothetical protein NTW21_44845 [Verrucomicrobia bacterium]|nr:hypothetical protein [Verrucomicrobiota bacterium]
MIYHLFKIGTSQPFLVQTRGLDGGMIDAQELAGYRARRPLSAPGGTLPAGSILILAPDAAGRMLGAGSVERVQPHRMSFENFRGGKAVAEAAAFPATGQGRKPETAAAPVCV